MEKRRSNTAEPKKGTDQKEEIMVKRKHAGGGAPKASVIKRLKNNES